MGLGQEGQILDTAARGGLLGVHLELNGEGVLTVGSQRQGFGEGELVDVALLKAQAALLNRADHAAFGIAESEGGVGEGLVGLVDFRTTLDRHGLGVDHSRFVVEANQERHLADHLHVVHEDHALVFVVVEEGQVDVLTRKIGEGHIVVGPFATQQFLRSSRGELLVEEEDTFGLDFIDDGGAEIVVTLRVRIGIDLEAVHLGAEIGLGLEGEVASGVGEIDLGGHHPVVGLAAFGIAGMRGGHEVGVGGCVVHDGPGVVVLVEEVNGLHFGRGLVVVALIEHGVDEALVEVLGQQVFVVGRNLALVGSLVAEFDSLVAADARQVGDDARGDADGIGGTLEEEGAGSRIDGHDVVGIGQEQFLLGLRLVVAVEISIARSYLHIGVEGQQDGRSRHVDFRQFRTFGGIHIDHADGVGSAALIRQANVSIRALGIALDVDSARGHIEGIVFILGELALAESNLESLARGVHLDSRGGIDHVAIGIEQAHGLVLASGHLDVAAEGDGDILQFRQLRTSLRRHRITVEQIDTLGNLRNGSGQRGYVTGVGIDHDGHGAPIFADVNRCTRVLKASMLEEVVAKLVL